MDDSFSNSSANTQPLTKISGLVERVTYHNETNGFCVLRLKVKGEYDLVTVVGNTPSVTPGEWVGASGAWITDREHGRQFKATFLKTFPPTSLSGIEKYLGSGMVKGIGPVYAKRLVKAFGTEVFEVIEKTPDRLNEIDGIGPRRKARIIKDWANQKVIRDIMVYLHGHGVSTSKAVRIFKTYGADAIRLVEENPYRLAKDIRGIGFRSADTIASAIGIEKNSSIRARAGVSYALSEASSRLGHCCMPRPELVKLATDLLDIPSESIIAAIDEELQENTVVKADFPQPDSIFLASLFFAEKNIAHRIRSINDGDHPWPIIDAGKAIPWVEKKLNITLARSQKEAVSLALQSKVIVITGGPGVGKTTLVKSLITILEAKSMRIQLCAPTGRAAKRLSESSGKDAKTIHRLLEMDPGRGGFKRNEENPLDCDLLIVDETSMVDVLLANDLLKAVSKRTAIFFVGDVDQLPSVGPGAFLNDLISSEAVPVVRLTEVFRQAATSQIIQAAHKINAGQFPSLPRKGEKSDFFFLERNTPEEISDTIIELVRNRLPKAFTVDPIHDIQVLCPMNKSGTGARALNELLQTALNPPKEDSVARFGYSFGVGDKVMQIENNYDRDVYNGDIGFVAKIDAEEQELAIDFDGRIVSYPYGELDEVVLCYASTIHKSQGSEYPVVVIPLSTQHFMMLQKNLVYTGVTRGKKIVVLVGQKRALAMALSARQSKPRWTGLRSFLSSKGGEGMVRTISP